MASPADPHPSRDELTALSDGRLAGPDATAVESHVATCDVCAAALGELGARNELVLRLRSAVDGDKTSPCVSLTEGIDEIRKFLEPSTYPGSQGRLGHYEILECLGQGAFGIVFRAFDDSLQRVVALKVLSPAMAATSPPRKRFLREARVAAQLRHEHVVRIYAVEELPTPYLVMEYIPGETLQERLDRVGPLEAPDVLRLGCQMARGLAAAHEQGLIHRDIKPGNILLEQGPEERVKITDFGLARAADDAQLTQSGIVAGTPMYMAPEQARGETIDQRADLFSLGSVLYTMVSGRPPFRASNTVAVLKRVCDDTPRPIPELIPETPQWLCDVIGRLQAKHPDDRFQTASEVAELLGECQSHWPHVPSVAVAMTSAPPVPRPAARTGRRTRWSIAAAAVLCLFGGLGLTEATGVTRLAGTVVRIVTGEGTLIIEIDDPTVQVALDSEELTISGGGVEQVRLRPGSYKLQATKDGQPIKTDVLTIERGDTKVVTIRVEPRPALTAAASVPGTDLPREIRRFEGHDGEVWSVAFAPDGRRIVSASGDGSVRVWDAETGTELQRFEGHNGWVYTVAVSRDGRLALSGSGTAFDLNLDHQEGGGTVCLWELESGKELQRLQTTGSAVTSVAFGDDDRQALIGNYDGTVLVWDVENWKELQRFNHTRGLWSVRFSDDALQVLTAGGYGGRALVRLWNLENASELRSFKGHHDGAWQAVFTPDGRHILSTSLDHTMRLWDMETGKETSRILHKRSVTSAAISADGQYILSGNYGEITSKTVHLWKFETGKEVCAFSGHSRGVQSVALSPDGRRAVSGGLDTTVRLWQLPVLNQAAELETSATENGPRATDD